MLAHSTPGDACGLPWPGGIISSFASPHFRFLFCALYSSHSRRDGPQEDLLRVPSSFVLRRGQHRRKFVPGRGSLEDMLLLKQHEALRRIWGVVPAEHGDDGDHEAGGPTRAP